MPLTRKQIADLGRAIERRRAALIDELRADAAKARGETYRALAGETSDRGDESVADLIADLDHADIGRDLGELRALEAARERIAQGRYGVCADCAAGIPLARLRAEPSAARCADCQRRREKTAPRRSSL